MYRRFLAELPEKPVCRDPPSSSSRLGVALPLLDLSVFWRQTGFPQKFSRFFWGIFIFPIFLCILQLAGENAEEKASPAGRLAGSRFEARNFGPKEHWRFEISIAKATDGGPRISEIFPGKLKWIETRRRMGACGRFVANCPRILSPWVNR